MNDIHCHLLPGLDDGPRTATEALDLARSLVDDGVRHVAATVHWTPGVFDNRAAAIRQACTAFAATLAFENIPLTLQPVTETRLHPEALELVARGEIVALGTHKGWKHLLLELPDAGVPPGALTAVNALLQQGWRPIIVHPERNKGIMADPERLRPFVEAGCLVQITAASVIGEFGSAALACSRALLDHNWVDAVASDAHNLRGRPPRMTAARELLSLLVDDDYATLLTESNPARYMGLALLQPVA
ncbi:tyrosine-protein phosphatase [Amphibiibacter pelophylacis]|uniref:CpsB/CapC family capsule biosynthesis tyrosine phosphatase n=1 Tax=Amphibiibacter pelophylacis TaxID=1799477 RepID=A0ACC6NZB3_9BURK